MSFKPTGRQLTTTRDEQLQFCDHCGKQISIDQYRSLDHWELRLDREVSYPDDDYSGDDFCSLECVIEWCRKRLVEKNPQK